MKNLKKLLATDLTEKQIDDKMSDLLADKFNKELKEKYSQKLKSEHDVSRASDDVSEVRSSSRNSIAKILIPVLAVAALLFGYIFLAPGSDNVNPASTEEQIEVLFASNEVTYIDNTRNTAEVDPARAAAIKHFQAKDYREAAGTFAQIENSKRTIQDIYYQSYGHLQAKQYMDALIGFSTIVDRTNKGDNYHPEAKLYQIITYVKLSDYNKAQMLYNELEDGSWEQKKLKDIVASLGSK